MNRLIIIGNGFDLAHNIKTSFCDFITDYFKNALFEFRRKLSYSDCLFEIKQTDPSQFDIDNLIKRMNSEDELGQIELINTSKYFKLTFHSLLLQRSYVKLRELNWVDLEYEFFSVLTATANAAKNSNLKPDIDKVNLQLEFLKSNLIKYLDLQQRQFSNLTDKTPLVDCFCENIYDYEIVTTKLEKQIKPDKICFLDFNYTNTIEDYIRECDKIIPSDHIPIHGTLSGVNGEPIFGFGDEFDNRYLEFENLRNNELFKHIKSFEYLKTKNYYRLTRFIESSDYQVHIYGHSCGISDRTMLNQIFEHDNCKSIKLYYHKIDESNNDYSDKTYEISRHFKNKGLLRRKLVPLELSKEMPQPVIISSYAM